ncbi:MAG: hypothetical protein O2970_11005, partial [Proteobacteria bacterium]|nr:hypothetical protein [Pseudomonadota bacterium]
TKKIFKAIKLASQSTVHSYCLQKNYKEIAVALDQKVDRIGKARSLAKGKFQKRGKTVNS